jgi:hypothetical protein
MDAVIAATHPPLPGIALFTLNDAPQIRGDLELLPFTKPKSSHSHLTTPQVKIENGETAVEFICEYCAAGE